MQPRSHSHGLRKVSAREERSVKKGSILQRSAPFWRGQRFGLFRGDNLAKKGPIDAASGNPSSKTSRTLLHEAGNTATGTKSQTCILCDQRFKSKTEPNTNRTGQTSPFRRYTDGNKNSKLLQLGAPLRTPKFLADRENSRPDDNDTSDLLGARTNPVHVSHTYASDNTHTKSAIGLSDVSPSPQALRSKTEDYMMTGTPRHFKPPTPDPLIDFTRFGPKVCLKSTQPVKPRTHPKPTALSIVRLDHSQPSDESKTIQTAQTGVPQEFELDASPAGKQHSASPAPPTPKPVTHKTGSERKPEAKFANTLSNLINLASEENYPKHFLWQEAAKNPESHAFLTAAAPHLKYTNRSWILDREEESLKIPIQTENTVSFKDKAKPIIPLGQDIFVGRNEQQPRGRSDSIMTNLSLRRRPFHSPHSIRGVRNRIKKIKDSFETKGDYLKTPMATSQYVPPSLSTDRQSMLYEETDSGKTGHKSLVKSKITSQRPILTRVHFKLDKSKNSDKTKTKKRVNVSYRKSKTEPALDTLFSDPKTCKPSETEPSSCYEPGKFGIGKLQPKLPNVQTRNIRQANSENSVDSKLTSTTSHNLDETVARPSHQDTPSFASISSTYTEDSKQPRSISNEKEKTLEADTSTGEYESIFCLDKPYRRKSRSGSRQSGSDSTFRNTGSFAVRRLEASSIYDVRTCESLRKGRAPLSFKTWQKLQKGLDLNMYADDAEHEEYLVSSFFGADLATDTNNIEQADLAAEGQTLVEQGPTSVPPEKKGTKRCRKKAPGDSQATKRSRNARSRPTSPKPKTTNPKSRGADSKAKPKPEDPATKPKTTDAKAPARGGETKAAATVGSKVQKRSRLRNDRMHKLNESSGTIYNLNRMFYNESEMDRRILHPLFDVATQQYRPPNNTARRAEERRFSKKVNIIQQLQRQRERKGLEATGKKNSPPSNTKTTVIGVEHKPGPRRPWK